MCNYALKLNGMPERTLEEVRMFVGNGVKKLMERAVPGGLEVPAHGQPIVMLADHQTTGGYPKMGVVATCDIPRLVQSPPGRTVRFERVSVEEAQALLRTDVAYLDGLARRWGRAAS